MKWFKVSEKRPPHGEWIWVWCLSFNKKHLVRYMGSQETWELSKDDNDFPIWAYLNDEEE